MLDGATSRRGFTWLLTGSQSRIAGKITGQNQSPMSLVSHVVTFYRDGNGDRFHTLD